MKSTPTSFAADSPWLLVARSVALTMIALVTPSSFSGAQTNATDAPQHLQASQLALLEGDYERSLAAARLATKANRQLGHAAAARALGGLQSWARAEAAATEAFTLDPSNTNALLLAWTLSNQDKFSAAIELLDRVLQSTAAEAPREDQDSGKTAVARELALLHLGEGNHEDALNALQGIPTGTEAPESQAVLGLVLAAHPDRLDQAASTLESALAATVENVAIEERRIRIELGRVLLELGETQEAVGHLQQAYSQGPQTADLAYKLSTAYRQLNQDQDAAAMLDEFQRLRSLQDENDAQQRALGAELNAIQELAGENQLDLALERIRAVLKTHPNSFSAHSLQAKILYSSGKPEPALSAIQRARELSPGIVEFHYLEGLFLRTLGRNQEAQRAFTRSLALDPDLVESHAILGGILLEAGDPEASLFHLDRAIELGADGQQIQRARELALSRSKGASP